MEGKKIKVAAFWKIYFVITFLLVVLVLGTWYFLWDFLKAYEKARVENTVDEALDLFNNRDVSTIMDYIEYTGSEYEDATTVNTVIKERIKETLGQGQWTCSKKNSESTEDKQVYEFRLDGKKTGILVDIVKQQEKGAYKTSKWKLEGISGFDYQQKSYNIRFPKGGKLIVNGKELDNSKVNAMAVEDESLVNVNKYIEAPKLSQFVLEGLYGEPTIEVKGPVYGNALAAVETKNDSEKREISILFGYESDSELIASQEGRIKQISEIYGKYVTNDATFSQLSGYILPDSYAYSFLSKISSTNKWYAKHTAPVFNDMSVFNYQSYTKECFSCEVEFTQVVKVSGIEHSFPTHLQYIFINKNNKWYMADIVIKEVE